MRLSKKFAAVSIVAASALVAGGALAFWSSSGEGSGSATAGTNSDFVVDSDTAVGALLTPGGPDNTVDFTVTNPSSGHQFLDAVAISVANADGGAWTSGDCSAADFVVDTYFTDPDANLAPGGVYEDTVSLRMIDTEVNQDDCRGVTVPLYISAS